MTSQSPENHDSFRQTIARHRFSYLHLLGAIFFLVAVSFVSVRYLVGRVQTLQDAIQSVVNAATESPLPDIQVQGVQLAAERNHYRENYDFTTDWFTPHVPIWEQVLAPYRGKPNIHYLEVGLFEGRSAIWVLENILTDPSARAMCIDVFEGPLKERYFGNVAKSGLADKVTTIVEPSQIVLRRLPLESFDIIYIDGSHAKDDVLEDAVLSYRLLKPGGIVIFDDYRWMGPNTDKPGDRDFAFPKPAIDAFLLCFHKDMTVIHNGAQLIAQRNPTAD